jgi:hypothetical protein
MAKSSKGFARQQERFTARQRANDLAKVGKTAAAFGAAMAVGEYFTQEASAAPVYSFRDLMDLSQVQNVRNYNNSLAITGPVMRDGQEITEQNFEFGGFTEASGGLNVTAYLDNDNLPGYPNVWAGQYDVNGMGIGNNPDTWMAVQKNALFNGVPYIGDLTNGNLTIAEGNNGWFDIEFDGVLNNYEAMPVASGVGTLEIDVPINIVPGPAASGLLGLGIIGVAAVKKGREVVCRLLGRLAGGR